MRPRAVCTAALAIVLAALAGWRASCVLAGPDVDTDAYAHHMIARAILGDPGDLAVHWVWLPLFHYLQVPLIALGGTMNDVRWANIAASAALPVMVFLYVRRTIARCGPGHASTSADSTALFASILAASCPIAMQMGTTAQPEPLFAITMFCVAAAFQAERYGMTAAWLTAGVLLRYEAWAALVAISAIIFFSASRDRLSATPATRVTRRAWLAVAAPTALILAWSALRRPVDGSWFGFLSQTHSFANDAMRGKSAIDRTMPGVLADILHYPLFVPARLFGPAIALAPFGIGRTVREQGGRFVSVLLACLVFVSVSWITRSSLGLDRHFVVVVPLYAIFVAQGAAAVGDAVTAWMTRLSTIALAMSSGRWLAAALAVGSLAWVGVALDRWMTDWRASIERGWPERVAVGAYLRSVPEENTIFCDEATVEILSGLDRRRFDRHWMDDPQTWPIVQESATRRGVAYVATWSRKLRGHEGAGSIVFRSGQSGLDPSSGLAVLRVAGEVGRASR
ncbi:MAG TPA: hypothetical protein VEK07_24685 [Polyangiaceae bacterium]|nr:hypothetical protein [Polyangiaceae bacterium]